MTTGLWLISTLEKKAGKRPYSKVDKPKESAKKTAPAAKKRASKVSAAEKAAARKKGSKDSAAMASKFKSRTKGRDVKGMASSASKTKKAFGAKPKTGSFVSSGKKPAARSGKTSAPKNFIK